MFRDPGIEITLKCHKCGHKEKHRTQSDVMIIAECPKGCMTTIPEVTRPTRLRYDGIMALPPPYQMPDPLDAMRGAYP